ncbi:MAG: transposase, partial [Alphaproteobacteria bacterium]|nr:transposase [Alphaproteobacteria bacterium]
MADAERRRKAGVPVNMTFRTKPEIALQQIKNAVTAGIPR